MGKLSKNLLSAVLLIAAVFILSSCNDEIDQIDEDVENNIEATSIVDGRLNFNSSETLKNKIEELKSQPESIMIDELEKFNNAGFTSLRPIVTENNLESVQQRYGLMTNGRSIDEAQEVTDYIGDDVFAAILNNEGLLQVGDSVYKYTPIIGLFFVHESKLEHLNKFLEELMGSQSNARSLSRIDPCPILADYNIQGGQVNSLDPDINYYSAIDPCNGGGGGSPYPNPTPTPSPSPSPNPSDPGQEFIDNLVPCDSYNGWASWYFGTGKICNDYFTSNSRIKTKFWNQDYWNYKSIGVKVKHQFKSLGIWYDAKIDELRLGLKNAYFDYKSNKINNNLPVKAFVRNGLSYDFMGQSIPITGSVPEFPLPTDLFAYVKLPVGNDNLITSDHINNVILKETIDAAEDLFGKHSTDDLLLMVEGEQKYSIVYRDLNEKSFNEKRIRNVFDQNFYISITIRFTSDDMLRLIQPPQFGSIASYSNSKVEVYGVGRRNSDWKGSLLIVEE